MANAILRRKTALAEASFEEKGPPSDPNVALRKLSQMGLVEGKK